MTILMWFLLGVMAGVGLAAVVFTTNVILFGDPDINEKLATIREARLDIEKSKTRTAFMRAFEKHRKEMEEIVK